jgi:tRNA threonylcarbamoyladenosine biosynthesis protein TsaB
MVILALDTTTRGGSVALWRDGLVDERAGDAMRTHVERLPGELAEILRAHGLALSDVDLYAVASGPGSFTGMRVGIATMQAMALVHGRLVVAISALDVLLRIAAERSDRPLVAAWMEAYRGEVFATLASVTRGAPTAAAPGTAAPEGAVPEVAAPEVTAGPHLTIVEGAVAGRPADLAAAWASRLRAGTPDVDNGAQLAIAGDAVSSTVDALRDGFGAGALLIESPRLAGTLAAMAADAPDRAVRPHAVVPVYVRRPDAVVGRERRAAESASPAAASRGPACGQSAHTRKNP